VHSNKQTLAHNYHTSINTHTHSHTGQLVICKTQDALTEIINAFIIIIIIIDQSFAPARDSYLRPSQPVAVTKSPASCSPQPALRMADEQSTYYLSISRRGNATGRALVLRSGHGFKSYSRQRCVTTFGKLFTPMCLCHQAV